MILLMPCNLQDSGAGALHLMNRVLLKGTNLRKPLLFAVLMLASLTGLYAVTEIGGAASQPATQAANPGKIGASAVWQPPQDFLAKAHAACDKSNPPNYAECFIDQMSKAGAPTEAVNFTRTVYQQSDGQVAIMTDF